MAAVRSPRGFCEAPGPWPGPGAPPAPPAPPVTPGGTSPPRRALRSFAVGSSAPAGGWLGSGCWDRRRARRYSSWAWISAWAFGEGAEGCCGCGCGCCSGWGDVRSVGGVGVGDDSITVEVGRCG